MLSFETLPPDPPQSLIKGSKDIDDDDDEKASPEVLDLPKFSIRDYVFTSRNKDIKTNWPFSQKNLQLCLKHGVKDLLPPFQSIDAVRNQSVKRCTVENARKGNLDVAEEPSGQYDHVALDQSSTDVKLKEKLVACTDTTTSCRSEGENDFRSTTTSVSQSEVEELVPTNRKSRLRTDTLLEAASVEVEAAVPPVVVSNKTESTTRPSGKKCKLVVKLNSHPERSSTEEIASSCTAILETMNLCPVCKTFSSSSNTTLNAHIDQCLSGESTPKCTVDSKPTRYKIKPRKTKLMVDIYETAQHCTLEDLDRRNGTTWASSISSFPTQDNEKSEMPAEEKRKRVSAVYPDDIDVGAVYVDANGTKVRILSKFDDTPSPSVLKVVQHLQPRKPMKRGKGSNFLSTEKKKHHVSKHQKYLKLAPQSKNFSSPEATSSRICEDQESYGVKESCQEEGQKMDKPVSACNPGALRRWACSKRTCVAKKLNKKHVSENPLVERDENCHVERNGARKLMNLSSSPENDGSSEDEFYQADACEKNDCFPQRKRRGSSFPVASISDNVERLLQQNSHHLSNDRNLAPDSCKLNGRFANGNFTPVLSDNSSDSAADLSDSFGSPPDARTKHLKSCAAPRPAMKCLPPKKNALSFGSRSSLTKSLKKCSAIRNQVHERAEVNKEVAAWDSEDDQPYDFMHYYGGKRSRKGDITDETSLGRSTVSQRRHNSGSTSMTGGMKTMALESSELAPECCEFDEREMMDTCVRVGDELLEKVDGAGVAQKEDQIHGNDIDTETSSPLGVRGTAASLCNSADGEIAILHGRSKPKSHGLYYTVTLSKSEALGSPIDQCMTNQQEMFCAEEVEDGTLGQNTHSSEEMDSEVGQESYFPEVDPIPIPGPPGSFLPSPRDMGSDDFQGNSSLTTSRVHSSQDQVDFMDGDSSDSPLSTTSTISNSAGTKFALQYSEPLSSIGPESVQDRIRPSLVRANTDSCLEMNAAANQQITGPAAERLAFDKENFKVNKISLERGPLSFKSNDQPCCCQRKERTSPGLALNYQESPLLRRRAMTLPVVGKPISSNPSTRMNDVDSGSDMTDTFFLSGFPTSRSEPVAFPVSKSSAGPLHLKGSTDSKGKFSGHGNGDAVSPSACNSILRLMGKNLMVVNRDEDASEPRAQATQLRAQNSNLTSQFTAFSGGVPANLQNQVCHSFPHSNFHHGSVVLGPDSRNELRECFDATHSSVVGNYSNPRIPQMLVRGPVGSFPKQNMNGGFAASLEPHDYKGGYSFPIQPNKYLSKSIGASTFQMDEVVNACSDRHRNNVGFASNANKEIIIIDDGLESESDLTCKNVANYTERLRDGQVVCSGIPVSTAPIYNSKRVNPLSCYESQDPALLCGSPVLYSTSLHGNAIPSRRANASPVKLSCTSEGSGSLQRTPFVATSSSRGHLRPALYNSPGFS